MNKHYICRKMFFRVLWPSLISSLTLSVANMADALSVGTRMGETGLAAIGLVTPLYMIYNVLGLAFSSGGSVTHSRLTANGREEAAAAHFKRLALLVLGISLAVALLGNLFLGGLLSLLGAGKGVPELRQLCGEYARPLLFAAPVMLLNFLLYDFIRCDNGVRIATLGFSVGCAADVGFNVLFVLVFGWGVRGSALATVLAQTLSVLIMLQHFFRGSGTLRVQTVKSAAYSAETSYLVGRSVRLGLATSMRYVFQFAFLLLSNRLLLAAGRRGRIDGEACVAVFDVVMNVSYLAYGLYQAFADTMQPLAATFSAEHDRENLRYLLRLALQSGSLVGAAAGILLALLGVPVSRLFGMSGETLAVSAAAIAIFCLSMPFAGVSIVLTGYYQSTEQAVLAGLAASFRSLVFPIPAALVLGLFFPEHFWWLFAVSEAGALAALLLAARLRKAQEEESAEPVFSAMLDRDDHELARVLEGVEAFCEEQEIPMKKAVLLQLAVEELCVVTIEQAFTGKPDEYIQLTVAGEKNGDYVLHIRNSAPLFNPLDMKMEKLNAESQEELMESVGVMMVKNKAKDLRYRSYQGFNVMTVRL